MKTLMINFIAIFLVFISFQSEAQTQDATDNYVVLTKKVQQLKPIILSAIELQNENKSQYGDFVVIFCGKEIGDITDPEKINPFIEMAKKANVKIVACGFSLSKFKVNQSKVPEELEIVENGILYNFQLQKKGYFSLSL